MYFERYLKPNVAMIKVAQMDERGSQASAPATACTPPSWRDQTVVMEVSDEVRTSIGGNDKAVHISDVDLIVESDENQPLVQVPSIEAIAVDRQVSAST